MQKQTVTANQPQLLKSATPSQDFGQAAHAQTRLPKVSQARRLAIRSHVRVGEFRDCGWKCFDYCKCSGKDDRYCTQYCNL